MKSVISALLIFIFIIVLCVSSGLYVNKITGEMLRYVYENENFVSKNLWDEGTEEIEKIKNAWKMNKSFMAVNYNHSLIDGIDMSVAKLENAIKMRKKEDFMYESSNLELMLVNLMELQKISIGNVF